MFVFIRLFVVDSVQLRTTDHTRFKNWYGWRQAEMQEHVVGENVYINNFSECPVPMKCSIILSWVSFRWELERIIRVHFANTFGKRKLNKEKKNGLSSVNWIWNELLLVVWHLEIADISLASFFFKESWKISSIGLYECIFS